MAYLKHVSGFVARSPRPVDSPPEIQAILARLGVHQVTTAHWTLVDDLLAARHLGYGAIGLWRAKLADHEDQVVADLIAESGLRVSSVSDAGGFTGSGLDYELALDDAEAAVSLAGIVNAHCVVVCTGERQCHTVRHTRRLVNETCRKLGDQALAAGTQLAVMPVRAPGTNCRSLFSTWMEALDWWAEFDHPGIRLALNTGWLAREPHLLDMLPQLAPALALVQLTDIRQPLPEAGTPCYRHCAPGDGVIPLTEVISGLLQAGYRGPFEWLIRNGQPWHGESVSLLADCRMEFLKAAGISEQDGSSACL